MSQFGYNLKALRLGFHSLPNYRGMMRMIALDGNQKHITTTRCDFLPHQGNVKWIEKGQENHHLCWWDEPEVLKLSPFLRWLRKIKKPFSIILDEEGRTIRCI